jgi:hypothetical protein
MRLRYVAYGVGAFAAGWITAGLAFLAWSVWGYERELERRRRTCRV